MKKSNHFHNFYQLQSLSIIYFSSARAEVGLCAKKKEAPAMGPLN